MTRTLFIIAAGFGVGLAAFGAAAPAQSLGTATVDQICKPGAVQTREEAERCVGANYHIGAADGLWPNTPINPAVPAR
jgi:hypothetical protein